MGCGFSAVRALWGRASGVYVILLGVGEVRRVSKVSSYLLE